MEIRHRAGLLLISTPEFARQSLFTGKPRNGYPSRMVASLLQDVTNWEYLISYPWLVPVVAFQLWMFIDAVRREEWIWALFIFIGFGL